MAHKDVWDTPADMWRAMVLIWNKEQAKQTRALKGEGEKTTRQQRVVLVQDPDDTGD